MSTIHSIEETRFLDVAYGLAKEAVSPLGHATAKDRLQQMFPALSFDEIAELYLRATALSDACYDAAEQCRDKKMTEAQATTALRQRFLGFSAKTYEQALSWGYFISR